MRLDINRLQVSLNDSEEEAPSVGCLIQEPLAGSWTGYNHLHLVEREGCLGKRRSILAEDVLAPIGICLVPVEE